MQREIIQNANRAAAASVLFPHGASDNERAHELCDRYLALCSAHKARIANLWPWLRDKRRGYDREVDGPSKSMEFVDKVQEIQP